MNKKLAVCVPYRDRKSHLDLFVPHLTSFLSNRGIDHKIFVCHQTDNKLFNRGKTKNIAFDIARQEGYDYFAFHDIDLLPEDDSCDYSYPDKYPVHLAARQSKDNYNLLYPQYFGGCVLFTREQFELVNGYYNDYWGWGWEDDDLFYRTICKGLADIQYIPLNWNQKTILSINNKKSYIQSINKIADSNIDKNGFSLMIVVKPEINIEDYLVGDKYFYFDTPVFSTTKYSIINYIKFECYIAKFDDKKNKSYITGDRGRKNEWSILFLTVDIPKKEIRFFINGIEASLSNIKSPVVYKNILKKLSAYHVILGNKNFSSFIPSGKKPFNGKIGETCLWNSIFTEKEIEQQIYNLSEKLYKDKMILWYDFEESSALVQDKSESKNHAHRFHCDLEKIDIEKITRDCKPHRRNGKFECLPHEKESFEQHRRTRIAKQSSTAANNEKIFKLQVQTGKIDTDKAGLSNLSYKLISKETIFEKHVMINIEC